MMNNVKELELHLMELNDSVKDIVTNGLEATELHILLSELDKTLTRGKEDIVRENCCYAEAYKNIGNLARQKENNDDIRDFEEFIKDIFGENKSVHKCIVNVDTKIKYELEFKEDKIGSYIIYFDNKVYPINIFKPNKIYANTRIVKKLVEDPESYIESYNIDKDYIIIRNDDIDKFVIFTRPNRANEDFYYLAPEEYCKDSDRI